MKFILCFVAVTLLGCQDDTNYLSQLKQPVQSDDYTIIAIYDLDIPNNIAIIAEVRVKDHDYFIFFGSEKGGMCHSESCPCKLKFKEK